MWVRLGRWMEFGVHFGTQDVISLGGAWHGKPAWSFLISHRAWRLWRTVIDLLPAGITLLKPMALSRIAYDHRSWRQTP